MAAAPIAVGGAMLTPRDALACNPFFKGLAPALLGQVEAIGTRRHWGAGATIFLRGDPPGEMALVLSGRVRLSVSSAEGRELGIRHAGAGDLFGEIALLDGAPRTADAVAATPVEALALPRARFLDLVAAAAPLAQAVTAYLCGRLRETTSQLEGVALYGLEARLARYLLALAEAAGSDTVRLGMTQSELADLLGASRQKINAALGALESAGAVRRRDDALSCDRAALASVAGFV